MTDRKRTELVGPYEIIECVSEGSIARVCRAVHTETGRRVLLRILDPLASRNKTLRSIIDDLHDAQSERRIRDPGVLRIVDVGKAGESCFVAYEDFDGIPLNEFLRQGRPPLRQSLQLAILMAQSLRAVHARHVVHGDIKPQNILVARTHNNRFTIKLAMADFAHSAAESMISVSGDLVGTPKYLSPEQIRSKRPTQASDIFALGIVFYELFSDREPFPADGPLGYLRANAEIVPQPLNRIDPAIPATLSKIVERMLQKDPSRRYRHIDHLIEDLERVEAQLAGATPTAPSPGTDSVFASAAGPNPHASPGPWRAVAITALAMCLLLSVALLVVLLSQFTARPQPPGAGAPPKITPPPESRTTAPKPVPPQQPPVARGTPSQATPVPAESPETTPPKTAPAKAPLDAAIESAVAALKAGNVEDAVARTLQIQSQFTAPDDQKHIHDSLGPVFLARAKALQNSGQKEEALALYRKAAGILDGTQYGQQAAVQGAEILRGRSNTNIDKGDIEAAVATLEQLVEQFPRTDAAKDAMRRLPLLRARYAEAVLPLDPDRAIKLLHIAAASASVADAPAIRKTLAKALCSRARRLMRMNKFDDCLRDLSEAGALDASLDKAGRKEIKDVEAQALYLKAKYLKDHDDFQGALAAWEKLQKRYPASKWVALGTREGIGKLEKTVGASGKSNAEILMDVARKKIEANNRTAARKDLETIITKYPQTRPARQAAEMLAEWKLADALLHWEAGRMPQGLTLLKAITKSFPDTTAARKAARHLKLYLGTPKDMVFVPGGEFTMGLDKSAAEELSLKLNVPRALQARHISPQILGKKLSLPPFYIDRHEVTNAQYKAYVDATGAPPPPSPAWSGNSVRKGLENYPVTNVTFREAAAYARWAGKRLPTEKEWEKAARGVDGRVFPWGNSFSPDRAVTGLRMPPPKAPEPVGSAPDGRSPYGALDMIGNVQEWTQSIFIPYGREGTPPPAAKDLRRAVRGAGYDEPDAFLATATARRAVPENARERSLGFRCAKDAE